jgi:hypothetical protein
MPHSDDDEIFGSITGTSTATYDQVRVEMEPGKFVVTGSYVESETEPRRCPWGELNFMG